MIRRFLPLALLLAAHVVARPATAQPSRSVLDSLVTRITHTWAAAPCTDGCVTWTVMHGDSTALRADDAEISGSDRTGMYTVTIRPARFAAPTLVGRLRIGHQRDGVVALRPIARGTMLTADDVAVHSVRAWGAPRSDIDTAPDTGTSTSTRTGTGTRTGTSTRTGTAPTAFLGTEARRVIAAGETLRPTDVTSAPVVFAGDTVTAEIIRAGVRLALTGTALQSASLGGRVAIRLDRGRRFAGIATGRNTVRLD